jgi:hypothetical protein
MYLAVVEVKKFQPHLGSKPQRSVLSLAYFTLLYFYLTRRDLIS